MKKKRDNVFESKEEDLDDEEEELRLRLEAVALRRKKRSVELKKTKNRESVAKDPELDLTNPSPVRENGEGEKTVQNTGESSRKISKNSQGKITSSEPVDVESDFAKSVKCNGWCERSTAIGDARTSSGGSGCCERRLRRAAPWIILHHHH
jgi:hypothetical protein